MTQNAALSVNAAYGRQKNQLAEAVSIISNPGSESNSANMASLDHRKYSFGVASSLLQLSEANATFACRFHAYHEAEQIKQLKERIGFLHLFLNFPDRGEADPLFESATDEIYGAVNKMWPTLTFSVPEFLEDVANDDTRSIDQLLDRVAFPGACQFKLDRAPNETDDFYLSPVVTDPTWRQLLNLVAEARVATGDNSLTLVDAFISEAVKSPSSDVTIYKLIAFF